MRHGRMFELLDAFTGEIAMAHADAFLLSRPLTLVTAAVDEITAIQELKTDTVFVARGAVTWCGNSSLEVTAEVLQDGMLASASRFTYVARDKATNRAAAIGPLVTVGDVAAATRERGGAERSRARRAQAARSLSEAPPTPKESLLIHQLYLHGNQFPSDVRRSSVLTADYVTRDIGIMHHDHRNIHGKVFGCASMLGKRVCEVDWGRGSLQPLFFNSLCSPQQRLRDAESLRGRMDELNNAIGHLHPPSQPLNLLIRISVPNFSQSHGCSHLFICFTFRDATHKQLS